MVEVSISDDDERSIIRSKTFPGIAEAMATQWTDLDKENK